MGVLNATGSAQRSPACPEPRLLHVGPQRTSAQDLARLGKWYFDRELYTCAAGAFKKAADGEPNGPSSFYYWGLSLERSGQLEPSLVPLTKAAELDAGNPAPRVAAGEVLDALQRRRDAESEWRLALGIDPSATTALDHLSADLLLDKDYLGVISLLGSRREGAALSIPQTLNLAEALALVARLSEAIEVLKAGLQRFPTASTLSNELATVQMLAGQHAEAYETLETALKLHPGDRTTEALYLRSLISGNADTASLWADKFIAEHPSDAEILYLSADLAWKMGNKARAEDLVKRSLNIRAEDYKAQQLYGTLLTQAGDLQGAQEHLQKAIALGDPDSDVRYQLSRTQRRLGDANGSKESMDAYKNIRASDKGRIDTAEAVEQGDQALRKGDPASAASLFRTALELSPDEALLHYKLSRALDQMHETSAERTELERALKLDPMFAEALNQMGYLTAHEGQPERAEEYFLAATKASPSYAVAWTNLAATFASETKWKLADDAADHALRIDPQNSTAKRIKASIAVSQSTP